MILSLQLDTKMYYHYLHYDRGYQSSHKGSIYNFKPNRSHKVFEWWDNKLCMKGVRMMGPYAAKSSMVKDMKNARFKLRNIDMLKVLNHIDTSPTIINPECQRRWRDFYTFKTHPPLKPHNNRNTMISLELPQKIAPKILKDYP